MAKNRVALVTGGAGFIGANLVRWLLKKKYDVHLTVKRTTNLWRIRDILASLGSGQNKLTLHTISLNNPRDLTQLVHTVKPLLIFHLATYGSNAYQTDDQEIIRTNVEGTFNLLRSCNDIPYEAFIHTGTSSEYGFKRKPMKETDVLEPATMYAATKAAATHIASVFAKTYKKPVVTIRPFSVYGPYEDPRRFIPTIIRNLIEQHPIKLTPGKQRRDFVYIDDVIDAYIAAAKQAKNLTGTVLNVGTDTQYTNDEVVAILFRVTGKRVPVKKGAYPKRSWDTSFWVADMSRAKKLLGWKPKVTLAEGLLKTYEWYKSQPQDHLGGVSSATSEVTDSPGEALAKRGWAPRR